MNRRFFLNKDIDYIISNHIVEYDLKQADISCLMELGKIDYNLYSKLLNMSKMYRVVTIGNMSKDKEFAKDVADSIKYFSDLFLKDNKIPKNQILSIKNDAIFLYGDVPVNKLDFGTYVHFIPKNRYTSYMKIGNLELYYRYDMANDDDIITIKGLPDDKLIYHESFVLKICDVFYNLENHGIDYTLEQFNVFYNDFLNRTLDSSYYREFNPSSKFRIQSPSKVFLLDFVDESTKNLIDSSYNLSIIRAIYKNLMTIKEKSSTN